MSGKNSRTPENPPEFDFPDFDLDETPEGQMPEPVPQSQRGRRTAPTWHEDDISEFADIPNNDEQDHGHHHENDGEDATEVAPETGVSAQKSLLSKLIFPVGGTMMVAMGALGIYSMGFFGSSHAPEQRHLAMQPQTAQMAPQFNPMPAMPVLPQDAQQPTQMAQAQMRQRQPAPGQMAQNQMVQPRQPMPVAAAAMGQMAQGQVQAPGQMQAGAAMPALPPPSLQQQPAEPAMGPAVEFVIRELVASTDNLNRTVTAELNEINTKLNGLAGEVNARLAETDKKVGAVGDKVTSLDGRVAGLDGKVDAMNNKFNDVRSEFDTIERRLSALEDSTESLKRQPVASTKGSAHTKSSAVTPPAGGINHRAAATMAEATPAAPAQMETIDGFSLRGVARGAAPTSAWIKTPSGSFVVNVGQTVAGAGLIKEIRRAGNSWEIVASNGLIRP